MTAQNFRRRDFVSRELLAADLAEKITTRLSGAIAERGAATIAVSGGTTPSLLFEMLSKSDIDWSSVNVTLIDERFVPESSPRSNANLVKAKLLQNRAKKANFLALYASGDVSADISNAEHHLAVFHNPLDAAILGMGNDGHTASFFPGGDNLAAALTGEGPAIAIRAPGAGEPRVTLTLPRLLDTAGLYLHIEGEEKLATLEQAAAEGPVEDMPIRSILRQSQTPLTIFWSP